MSEYYYSKLTKREQGHYHKLLEAVKHGDSMVKAGPFVNSESIIKVVNAVNYDHPELFYADFRHLNYTITPAGTVYQVNYNVKFSLRATAIDELERKIDDVVNMVHRENLKSDYEKCRWIHNYLVKNIRYNYEALKQPDNYPDSFGVRGVFNDKLAVCEGVSKAFKVLCDRLGVDTMIAFGTSSLEGLGTGIPHAWNIVCLEGQFSHIDVTWDIGMSVASQYTRFDYFCLPDRCMKTDHIYEGLPECTTDSFSYFCKRKRWFSRGKQLQEYLESELKKGASILYFRAENKKGEAETFAKKIQDQVNRTVSKYYNGSYLIEMMPNEKQMCFFFRITKQ